MDDEEFLLDPITEREGEYVDDDGEVLTIARESLNRANEQLTSMLEPGHVVHAEIVSDGDPFDIQSLKHRGGFTLVRLDSRSVPYLISEYLSDDDSPNRTEEGDDPLVIPFSAIEDRPFDGEPKIGEAKLVFPSDIGDESWLNFCRGVDSEAIYGQFDVLSERPTEVFVGNARGEPYWYAILFSKDRTAVARRIRAQFGYLYDDRYIPNPAWDLSKIIDREKLPEDPSRNPKAVFGPNYNVRSDQIPERFGTDTIDLIAELVWVASHFDFMISDTETWDLEADKAMEYGPEDLANTSPSIHSLFNFYVSLLTGIYETTQDNPDSEIDTLIETGQLPDPELLYRTEIQFESQIHSLQSYLDKMEQVPIEKYVVNSYSGDPPIDLEEMTEPFDVTGLPLLIRRALFDFAQVLDEIREVLKVANYIADVEPTGSGYTYDIKAKTDAYEFVTRHKDTISNHIVPADLGGEDPGVRNFLLGRIGHRHPWLNIELFNAFSEAFD